MSDYECRLESIKLAVILITSSPYYDDRDVVTVAKEISDFVMQDSE